MIDINNIAVPSIIDTKYDDLKEALVRKLQDKIPGYTPHESDRYMPIIEAAAYRELILRERINSAIKSMLLPSAEGEDLDLVAVRYGIERNPGAKPRATITLIPTKQFTHDETILAGTILTDSSKKYFGRIVEDIVIPADRKEDEEEDITGVIELDEYVIESYAQTTLFINPLPYIQKATVSKYEGGLPPETDEAFRKRILWSLERFTTAGSKESYAYHAMSASTLVKDVFVENAGDGKVQIWIQLPGIPEEQHQSICDTVYAAVNEDKVRPLTDIPNVQAATEKSTTVIAELELYDEQLKEQTVASIAKALTEKSWVLGEDLNISYLYKELHGDNVSRAILISPDADTDIKNNEFVSIVPSLTVRLKPATPENGEKS